LSEEHKARIGASNYAIQRKKGNKVGHRTRGENEKLRSSTEYRLWRESVLIRDNYVCVWCFAKGVPLHVDHIKPFALFPELRFAIDNGRTLCVPCHKTTDTYGGKIRKYGI